MVFHKHILISSTAHLLPCIDMILHCQFLKLSSCIENIPVAKMEFLDNMHKILLTHAHNIGLHFQQNLYLDVNQYTNNTHNFTVLSISDTNERFISHTKSKIFLSETENHFPLCSISLFPLQLDASVINMYTANIKFSKYISSTIYPTKLMFRPLLSIMQCQTTAMGNHQLSNLSISPMFLPVITH